MTSFTVATTDLHTALMAVTPHMPAKDPHDPLRGVRFAVTDKHVEVLATDRKTLAVFTIELVDHESRQSGSFLLDKFGAKDWTKLARDNSRGATTTRVDVQDRKATIEITPGDALQRTAVTEPASPINYDRLVPGDPQFGPPAIGLDSEHLAKFAKLGTLRFQFSPDGPNKPVKVTVPDEDRFLGLLMPIKVAVGEGEQAAEETWRQLVETFRRGWRETAG